MDQSTKKQYYTKALNKMVKAYEMALAEKHVLANQTIKLPSVDGKQAFTVMPVENSIEWIVKHLAPELLNSSWRIIRSGLKLILDSQCARGKVTKEKSEELKTLMHQKCWKTKSEKLSSGESLNSTSKRKKSITQEEYDRICEFINNPDKKQPLWGKPTLLWLTCSMLTGLRPNEWTGTELVESDGKLTLVVKNFKHDEIRAPGEFRVLDISGFSEGEVDVIRQHISMANVMREQGIWDKYYRGCSNLLGYVNSVIFGRKSKMIGLYTGRHQFTANLKASDMKPKERSALLGHSSTDTQVAHYGKRRSGKNMVVPRNGNPESEKQIRDNQKLRAPTITPQTGQNIQNK
jgi:hypothetical protein